MSQADLIAVKERLNELKAQRRGLDIMEDEALETITYTNERRPMIDELIGVCERKIEDFKRGPSQMADSDSLWSLARLRDWTNHV